MRKLRPQVAALDEVKITRSGLDTAIIEYLDDRVSTTHFKIGPEVQRLSDSEILDRWNDCVEARNRLAAAYKHVAVEVPPGKPQIKYFAAGSQWTPRGGVLRCVVDDGGAGGMPVIYIDEKELSWEEFGRMLTTWAGWGMRIVAVPDDEIEKKPRIEVREPDR